MLVRTDPFRDLDRIAQQVMGNLGTLARPAAVPMDAWRDGDTFVVELDLPGVQPDSIDLDVERNVLTVRAERPIRATDADLLIAERPKGVFTRQLVLSEALDTEAVQAHYESGVLTLRIPIAAKAKPRKISITGAHTAGRGDQHRTHSRTVPNQTFQGQIEEAGNGSDQRETGQEQTPALSA